MTQTALEQGITQFNQQDFYACHDTLEAIWLEAIAPEKNFYQGILQIAAGCYHLGNDNWRGAVILLGEGIRRLADYTPNHHQVNVERLREDSYHLLQCLQQIDPSQAQTLLNDPQFAWPHIDYPMTLP